jgi:hypothetical protein
MRTKTYSNSHKYVARSTGHPSVVFPRVYLIHNEQGYEISENKTDERLGIDSLGSTIRAWRQANRWAVSTYTVA